MWYIWFLTVFSYLVVFKEMLVMAPGADAITNALPPLIWTNYFVPHKTLKTLALFIIAVPGPSGAPVLIIALQSLYSKACLQRLQVLGRGCSLSRRSGKKGGGADRGEFCQVGMFWWQQYLVLSPTWKHWGPLPLCWGIQALLEGPGPDRSVCLGIQTLHCFAFVVCWTWCFPRCFSIH